MDWDLFQGPAPRREYTQETWDYNWHWYGWDYGTAESGNNGTHELDVARWALQVDYPTRVDVEADKRHFVDDGWEMYDDMEVTFRFAGDKVIAWDGKSRNGYMTYGTDKAAAAADMSAEEAKVMAQLRQRIAELAMAEASSALPGRLNADSQQRLIDRSISMLGGN